jgi:non-homologous end joining protein Ku
MARASLDVERYPDRWAARVATAVERKVAGEQIVVPPNKPEPAPLPLVDALRLSLKGPKKAAPRPAKKVAGGASRGRRASA